MFFSARRAFQSRIFDVLCRKILDTPPLEMKSGTLTFCSMASHRDLVRYVLAIKSIYWQIGVGDVVVIDDGSMVDEDHALLKRHIPLLRFIPIKSVSTSPCPRGGTWERLVTITELCQQRFVVQVDSDTLTIGSIDEVKRCIDENRSFTLPGGSFGAEIKTLQETAKHAANNSSNHIQIAIEKRLPELPAGLGSKYVRGCSGFAGFARGSATREQLAGFSTGGAAIVGDRWSEWGTEQVASNFLIANAPGAVVLPSDRYVNFNGRNAAGAAFVHYIGTHRFSRFDYALRSRKLISDHSAKP